MSIAGRRSSFGDEYQLRVALHWLIRLLKDDTINYIQVDSTGLPGEDSSVTVDDIVVLYKNGYAVFIQAKKNQPKHEAWSFSDEDLKKELCKARDQLESRENAEVMFYSRSPFGEFKKLVEDCKYLTDYSAFRRDAPKNQLKSLEKLAAILNRSKEITYSLVKLIRFGSTYEFDDWDRQNQLDLEHYVTQTKQAVPILERYLQSHQTHLRDTKYTITRSDVLAELAKYKLLSTPKYSKLDELTQLSKARCISLWQAAGVPRSEAIALADDASLGLLLPEFHPNNDKPLVILIGEFGAGKSLIAERLFQEAIKQACSHTNAPTPVYLKAQKVVGQLIQAIEAEISKLGKSLEQGVNVIIDGADEAGSALATDLLNEARVIVNAWVKSTIVITSRPIPALSKAEEVVEVPPLNDSEAYALVERFSNQPIDLYVAWKWAESIRDAIRRPLFAVLLGIYLKNQSIEIPNSPGELLSNLVERSLLKARTNNFNIDQILQRLATLVTDHSKGSVSKFEIGGTTSELQMLLDSGLVVEDAGTISFPLPIIAQWFAAQSLATDIPNLSNLALDPERLERWRYPLAIFVGTYDHDRVSRALTPLVQKHPAFISQIVSSELARAIWDSKKPVSLPPTMECGQRIRAVMQAWIDGIEPLSQLIAPVRLDSTLLPVGVHTLETYLTTSWYYGNENKPDIVVLPSSHFTPSYDQWPTVRRGEPSHKLAWAWDWTFKELVGSLSELLQRRMLPVSDGPIFRETIWQVALIVTQRGKFHNSPILFSEIEECLSILPSNIFPSGLKNYEREYYIKLLVDEVNRLYQIGEVELHPLYPKPDVNINGWTRDSYSEQQLLARVKAIYSKAIEGYQQLVNTWFPKFAPRLATAVTLPARLVGVVTPSRFNTEVGVEWYFEALPQGKSSYVDLSFGKTGILMGNDHLYSQVDERLLFLRKDAAAWISAKMHSQLLSISNPNSATELAYKWLWSDLNQVAWVDGTLGNAPNS